MDSRIDPDRIQDILELQRLKGLYFYNLDHKDWDTWRSLFTSDAKLLVDRDGATDVYDGMENVIAHVSDVLAIAPSVHHGHTPLYEFHSEVEAGGIWAMSDIIYYSEESVLYGYGHYRERYRKEGGIWKFSSVHLTRLKIDIIARKG
jgi:hypothetical protein